MEIIYPDIYYDTTYWEDGKFRKELTSELVKIDKDVKAKDVDIGMGADFPSVLVDLLKNIDWGYLLVTGIVGAFFLGEKINKNIDAWKEIIEKFKLAIKKFHPARIDEKGALLLVLDKLGVFSGKAKETDISVQIIPFEPVLQGRVSLDKRPNALYIVTVKIPYKVYVVGIKSNTKIVFLNEYSTEWLEF